MSNSGKSLNGASEMTRLLESNNNDEKSLPAAMPEDRSRCRLFLLLSLFSSVLIMTAILAVWHGNRTAASNKAHAASHRAKRAIKQLNADLHRQSKHIQAGCESTLILLRHCEKHGPSVTSDVDRSEHCSYVGLERAAYLATLFGGHKGKYPVPSHLFALTPDRSSHHNFREWETLQPLAEKTGTMVEIASHPALAKDYFELLQSGSLCGQVVVVSWKHSYMGELATRLGCSKEYGCPEKYKEYEFDEFWQIKYVFHPPDVESIAPNGENSVVNSTHSNRRLHSGMSRSGWNVFGSVARQGFDPLAFSYAAGDYPPNGISSGGAWKSATNHEL